MKQLCLQYSAIPFCHSDCKYLGLKANNIPVDPDQTALKEQSDQGLHCMPFFQLSFDKKSDCSGLRIRSVITEGVISIFGVIFDIVQFCFIVFLFTAYKKEIIGSYCYA